MVAQQPSALIVDDDPVALIVLRQMLESHGIDVIAENTVSDARSQLQSHNFDLVFVDYVMPGETGLDLLEDCRGIPVVLLTGYRSQSELSDERSGLVDAYITKPVSSHELHMVVDSIIDRKTTV